MKLNRIACAFSLLAGVWLQPIGSASVTTPGPRPTTATNNIVSVKGVLIDKDCSYNAQTRVVGDHLEGGILNAYIHEKKCLLKPESRKAGYGIFTYDQEFLQFDEAGNRKALALVRATTQADNFRVTVEGTRNNDTITVRNIGLNKE